VLVGVRNSGVEAQERLDRSGERELVPKAGLYQRGLLKSLMTWAIPFPTAEYSLKPVCRSLFHLLGLCPHLLAKLTPI